MELSYKTLQKFLEEEENIKTVLKPTTIIASEQMTHFLTKKSYGPYMKNGKQFWRNYHRLIKRKDAKSFLEVQYLDLPERYQKLFCGSEET